MIKLVALLKARAGMDRDAFIERYETGHAPLIERLLPLHSFYGRNYIRPPAGARLDHAGAPTWFDVLTMLRYDDAAQLAELGRRIAQEGIGAAIAEDERAFLDRERSLMMTMDEVETPRERLQPPPPGHVGPPRVKQIALLKRKQGMTAEAFREYYEQQHAGLAMKLLARNGKPVFAGYARNYPLRDGQSSLPDCNDSPSSFGYDVISEFWFWTRADFDYLVSLHSESAIGAAMDQDEEQLFDRSAMRVFEVDERVSR